MSILLKIEVKVSWIKFLVKYPIKYLFTKKIFYAKILNSKNGDKMFAEVIINSNARALNKIFDYIVPNGMEKKIKIGARVFVPFGNGKKLEDGFIVNLKENSEFANKEISS